MRHTTLLPQALLLATILLLASCDSDDPGPDCSQAGAKAELKISQTVGLRAFSSYVADTFTTEWGAMRFDARGSRGQVVNWQIGTDARDFEGERIVGLLFDDPVNNLPIKVRVSGGGVVGCDVPTADTAEATITLRPPTPLADYRGWYQGSLATAPADTFTVFISPRPTDPPTDIFYMGIDNLPKGFIWSGEEFVRTQYKRFYLDQGQRTGGSLASPVNSRFMSYSVVFHPSFSSVRIVGFRYDQTPGVVNPDSIVFTGNRIAR